MLLLQYGGFNPSHKTIEKYWNKTTEFLTFNHFIEIIKQERNVSKVDILGAFKRLDQNNDGYLDHQELMAILTKKGDRMTKAEINNLLKSSDFNGDGKLNYQEFCNIMEETVKLCQKFNSIKHVGSQANNQVNNHSKPSQSSQNLNKEESVNRKESTQKLSLAMNLSSTKRVDEHKKNLKIFLQVSLEPGDLNRWHFQSMKGCIYKNDDGKVFCQQYILRVTQPTTVWVTVKPGSLKYGCYNDIILNTDVMLFLVEEGLSANVIAYTNSFVNGKLCFQADLGTGTYRVLSYSSGNNLMGEKSTSGQLSIIKGKGDEISLTKPCSDALLEIFHRYDLNSNGYLSRDEFNEFQMRSSGELCDNEAWQVLKETVELTPQDEIPPNSFLSLHLMEAKDPDGGQDELWLTLESMGYSRKLNLIKACPFYIETFTSRGKSILLSSGINNIEDGINVLKNIIKQVIDSISFKNSKDLLLFVGNFNSSFVIAVENQGMTVIKARIDCSKSVNLKSNRESLDVCEKIGVKEMKIVHHLTVLDPAKPTQLHYVESAVY